MTHSASVSGALTVPEEPLIFEVSGWSSVFVRLLDELWITDGSVTAEVSYDGGLAYLPAPMLETGIKWKAVNLQGPSDYGLIPLLGPVTHLKLTLSAADLYEGEPNPLYAYLTFSTAPLPSVALPGTSDHAGTGNILSVEGPAAMGTVGNYGLMPLAGLARTGLQAPVSDLSWHRLLCDATGRPVTIPYQVPEMTLTGVTADLTTSGSVQVIAAQGSGTRIYVTHVAVRNSHASVGTWVNLKDGSTTIWTDYAAPNGGGFAYPLVLPLRGTANTALNVQCETPGANVRAAVVGFKSN